MNNTIVISRNGIPEVYYNREHREFVIDQARLESEGIDTEAPFYFLHNEDTGNTERFVFERTDPEHDSEYMDGEPYEGYIYTPLNPDLEGVSLYLVDKSFSNFARQDSM